MKRRRRARVSQLPLGADIRPTTSVHVTVISATVDQLFDLVDSLGQREYFSDRLERQARGEGVLLVAWLDDQPVGDVYLWRSPVDEPEIREQLPGVPELNHLEVHPDYRSRGIGTQIIAHAEATAAQLGHQRIGICVGVDNPRAHELYIRLGYTDWGHGTVDSTYASYTPDGTVRRFQETIHVLTKTLGASTAVKAAGRDTS
jgi:GNAT superfamily N-acetyltransferase